MTAEDKVYPASLAAPDIQDGVPERTGDEKDSELLSISPPSSAPSVDRNEVKAVQLDDQNIRLPFSRLITVYLCLATCFFVSFMDVNSTTTALPAVAASLNAQNSITWAGTSYLIAQAAFQVLYGRFSDIFGRKPVLLFCVGMLIAGDILCGFAQNPTWLYVSRALSGIGGGGISSLVQIIVSDLVSLKERGKYQGVLSGAIGLGAGTGPFIAAGLLKTGPEGWRWAFWVPAILAAVCVPCLMVLLPAKPITGSWKDKVRKIDGLGLGTAVVALLFILVGIARMLSRFRLLTNSKDSGQLRWKHLPMEQPNSDSVASHWRRLTISLPWNGMENRKITNDATPLVQVEITGNCVHTEFPLRICLAGRPIFHSNLLPRGARISSNPECILGTASFALPESCWCALRTHNELPCTVSYLKICSEESG